MSSLERIGQFGEYEVWESTELAETEWHITNEAGDIILPGDDDLLNALMLISARRSDAAAAVVEDPSNPRIIGTLYDADRRTAWLGANDFVYRWWSKEGWGHPQAEGLWSGIHKSNIAAHDAGEVVMSYSLIHRLNSPYDFEHQGPYISIADLDNPPDRAALLDEPPMDERDRRFGLGGMPRP